MFYREYPQIDEDLLKKVDRKNWPWFLFIIAPYSTHREDKMSQRNQNAEFICASHETFFDTLYISRRVSSLPVQIVPIPLAPVSISPRTFPFIRRTARISLTPATSAEFSLTGSLADWHKAHHQTRPANQPARRWWNTVGAVANCGRLRAGAHAEFE